MSDGSVIRAHQALIDDSADTCGRHQHISVFFLFYPFLFVLLSMSQPWDYIAKLVCIGDSGTGKSSVRIVYSNLIPLLILETAHCPTL